MSIRVALNHKTTYAYDRLVTLHPHVVRLRPAPHARTPVVGYSLRIGPKPHFLNWQQDAYSNYLARLVFPKPARELSVEVDLVVELEPFNPFDFFVEETAKQVPFAYDPALARELIPFREALPITARMAEFFTDFRQRDQKTIDFLVDLNRHVKKEVNYVIRMEPGVQAPDETLTRRSGSCRDSAWLLVQSLRQIGLAARFVSGYLIQLAVDEKSLDGPSGPENDFTDLHAWAEVYLPGAGWVGLDPTSGLLASEGHIPLACAADPTNAAPITGSFAWTTPEKGVEDFHVQMAVTRIRETPRVTKPYTEEQWDEIDRLGDALDQELREGDVRLTMGGEPTFVALDDRDLPEWNTTALGDAKRRRAAELLTRLRDRFAYGGFLHHGQGKWYPGESLPRWTFSCYWRRDKVPIWKDRSLVADLDRDYGHGPEEAHVFMRNLAFRLGVDTDNCAAAFEDAWYYMWLEQQLPTNVDPLQADLDDSEDRRRLARLLDQGLKRVVGYALPLRRRAEDGAHWQTGKWTLRREHLVLLPGDSPMGYRLPLESLPWEPPETRDVVHERDPLEPRPPLPLIAGHAGNGAERNGKLPHASDVVIRTALCVEPRGGRLHVFLPPVERLEDYLELVAAIEATAASLRTPILLEGYKPPYDPRVNSFDIMPDPGVIEVNIHPSHSWREMSATTAVLYEEARKSRLTAEKFMVDGRHCGTGGGNHIVLGGRTPADSPLLRRPDLLRSLLGCWHNHPSLSYLFSSLFVGPTSQAPRVDEARNDSLYELELAFRQIPDKGECSPWLVDRVFRNLLIDVTGNTHRSEFCIDKLYSPDRADGRRGLLELRAMEMPPHSRMSLVQQLLFRALVARFWRAPYRHSLVRWGTELHDRFMLPHFVEQDFDDLLEEMRQSGYPLRKEWFAPHLEFRFPHAGELTCRGVRLELRHAIEPWHVLGEEVALGGTARYVDSSVERLQVKVQGMIDKRHVIACNGVRLSLHPTGTCGEYVGGVRYRAWQPPSCLHPTIPVDSPLVFDVYDAWTGRSLGGCQYHVAHPGGLAYDAIPVNAEAAEARRLSRFVPFGHTPASWTPAAVAMEPEFPFTLDLRKVAESAKLASARLAAGEVIFRDAMTRITMEEMEPSL